LEPLRSLIEYATLGLTPDMTVYLDIDVRAGLARKRAGAADEWNRMEAKTLAFHEAVREGYLRMAAGSARWLVVDATQRVDEIHRQIMARVAAMAGTV
jgi:dTMP kinase